MRRSIFYTLGVLACAGAAHADQVTFIIHSLQAPMGGVLSPTLLTTHDGTFDQFDQGAAASTGVERLAEDGNASVLQASALGMSGVSTSSIAAGGPIMPGETRMITLSLDPTSPTSRFFSFMSMFVPSNDAFIGNDDPTAFQLFDSGGNLIRREGSNSIVIPGSLVWDGGTEVNDELPGNALGLGPSNPNMGVTENGVVRLHPGFIGSFAMGGPPLGNILIAAPNADFTVPGFVVAEISVLPAPSGAGLLGLAALTLMRRRPK